MSKRFSQRSHRLPFAFEYDSFELELSGRSLKMNLHYYEVTD